MQNGAAVYEMFNATNKLLVLTLTRSCTSDALKNQSSLIASSSMISYKITGPVYTEIFDEIRQFFCPCRT